jgi:hypothetical protein
MRLAVATPMGTPAIESADFTFPKVSRHVSANTDAMLDEASVRSVARIAMVVGIAFLFLPYLVLF